MTLLAAAHKVVVIEDRMSDGLQINFVMTKLLDVSGIDGILGLRRKKHWWEAKPAQALHKNSHGINARVARHIGSLGQSLDSGGQRD